MTVASTTNKSGPYNGNGSTANFAVNFKYTNTNEVSVIVTSAAGVETTKVLDTHYTLTPAGDSGTVSFITAPTDHRPQSGETVTIVGVLPVTQATDLTSGGSFAANTIEGAFDKLTRLVQQIAEKVTRAPKLRVTTTTGEITLPEPEAGKTLVWNTDEDGFDNEDAPGAAVVAAAASALAAAGSASAASISASSASDSAIAAQTAETNAETAETNAETAETNAEAAQLAAEAAQLLAEAARDAAIAASQNPALQYVFDDATADADPGSGEFRINNATPGSATELYFDNVDADGNTQTGWLDAFDDNNDTTSRGILLIKGITTPTAFLSARVTGTVTDGTGYRKISITPLSSGGTFTAGDDFAVTFAPAGDKGDAGDGDVTGPASATDSAITLFAGTDGKTVKNSVVTINSTGIISGGRFLNAGLQVLDSDASHVLTITPSSNLGGNRVLSLATGDASRTLTISGNATISQDYSTTGNPQFATIELGAASDTTLARASAGNLSIEGNLVYRAGGTDVPIDDGGTGASTAADAFTALKQTADETDTGVLDLATDAEIRAATTGAHAVTAADLETAAAFVSLTETSGAVAVDWDTFINGTVTVDQATVISNPTNGQPGTFRHILVQGNDATDRTITFGDQFLGEVPTITDCDSTRWYLLSIICITASHFAVSAKKVLGT